MLFHGRPEFRVFRSGQSRRRPHSTLNQGPRKGRGVMDEGVMPETDGLVIHTFPCPWEALADRPSEAVTMRLRSDLLSVTQHTVTICGVTPATAAQQLELTRDCQAGHAGQALRTAAGAGRMAYLRAFGPIGQHHSRTAAAQMPRVEPGQKRLAVHT